MIAIVKRDKRRDIVTISAGSAAGIYSGRQWEADAAGVKECFAAENAFEDRKIIFLKI